MKKTFSFLLPVLLLFAFTSFDTGNGKEIKNKIDNILKWEEQFGFSGSVLIVKDGKIILDKGYGFANSKAHFMNTPKTAFYIASVSKPITALAVMKLVEEKKINLHDPLTKYFPNVPDDKKDITIEMLLTHTSGLKQTYSCDNIPDRDKAIETIFSKTPMLAAAGAKYNYSGDNYSLLAALIEIVTHTKFERFVTDKIFTPAGIGSPGFAGDLQLLKYEDIAEPGENSTFKNMRELAGTWGQKGRAGMILSVEDLYKIDAALEGNKILRAATVENILSPKIKSTGVSNYGYGFDLFNTIQGTKVFGHSGDDDNVGHNFMYLNFPAEKVKIFIGSNSGLYSGTSWSMVISSLIQRVLFPSNYTYASGKLFYNEFMNHPAEKLEKFEGVYQSGNINYHVFLKDEQQLMVCPVGNDVAASFGYPEAYSSKNSLSRLVLEETHNKQYTALQESSRNNETFEQLKKLLDGFWQSLEKNNGALDHIEVLGTANTWSGHPQADVATWFRVFYKNTSRLYRLEWDAENKITGLGGSRIPYPMMFTLNAIAAKEFIGFDPANGKTIAANFLTVDQQNKSVMELRIGEGKTMTLYNTGDMKQLPKRSAAELLYRVMINQGIAAADNKLTVIKENKDSRFDIDEDELNEAGYKLLREDKTQEAIAMFIILTREFPESSNAFDSLGDGYMKAGNKADALKSYKKAVELDAGNEHSKKMVNELSN